MKKKKGRKSQQERPCSFRKTPSEEGMLRNVGKVLLLTASYELFSVFFDSSGVQAAQKGPCPKYLRHNAPSQASVLSLEHGSMNPSPGIYLSCIGCVSGPDNVPGTCSGGPIGCSCTSGCTSRIGCDGCVSCPANCTSSCTGGCTRCTGCVGCTASHGANMQRYNNAIQVLQQAKSSYFARRFREAVDLYQKMHDMYPEGWNDGLEGDMRAAKAMIDVTDAEEAERAGDDDRAASLYREAISTSPSNAHLWQEPLKRCEAKSFNKKGIASYKAGDWAGSLANFREALKRFPEEKVYQENVRLAENQQNWANSAPGMHQNIQDFVKNEPPAKGRTGSEDLDFMGETSQGAQNAARPPEAQERPQSVSTLFRLLSEEGDRIDRDREAVTRDCSIILSNDEARKEECQARNEDIARRIKKYHADENAFEERKARLEIVETKMAALEQRIAQTNKQLKGYSDNARLDGYERSIEEWAKLAEGARQKAKGAAIEGMIDLALESGLIATEKRMVNRETLEKLTGMSQQKFLTELERQVSKVAKTTAPVGLDTLGDGQKMIKLLDILKNGFVAAEHMETREREDYYRISLKFLAMVNTLYVGNPAIALAIADAEVVTAAAYGWTARGFAMERIEQLAKVREEDFKAIQKLTVLYQADIDKRNTLRKEKDQILHDAGHE